MEKTLRIAAVVLALGVTLSWVALGANRGWTRTSVAVKTLDDVTGIEGIEYRKQFVPGLELLGGALLGTGFLAGASLLFGKSKLEKNKQ
jgi:hypothetical protein